jgi:hypothetical protein
VTSATLAPPSWWGCVGAALVTVGLLALGGCRGPGELRTLDAVVRHRFEGLTAPAVSGLAPFGPGAFVAVHDARMPGSAGSVTDRVSVIVIGEEGEAMWIPLDLGIGSAEPPKDLESIAAVPGRPDEFLLLESGGGEPQRRLFRCRVACSVEGRWTVELLGAPIDVLPETRDLANVEAFLAVRDESGDEVLRLLLADRTPQGSRWGETGLASVRAVELRLKGESAKRVRTQTVVVPVPAVAGDGSAEGGQWRAIADLAVGVDGSLIAVSARDGGPDGPFESLLHRLGRLEGLRLVPGDARSVRIAGHKVEGLTIFHTDRTDGGILCGSDDEALGGAVFAVDPPKP